MGYGMAQLSIRNVKDIQEFIKFDYCSDKEKNTFNKSKKDNICIISLTYGI